MIIVQFLMIRKLYVVYSFKISFIRQNLSHVVVHSAPHFLWKDAVFTLHATEHTNEKPLGPFPCAGCVSLRYKTNLRSIGNFAVI